MVDDSDSQTPPVAPHIAEAQKRLLIFSVLAWACTFFISTLYPLDRPVDELTKLSFFWAYAWVAAQAFLPIATIVVPLLLLTHISTRWVGRTGTLMLAAVPAIVLLDCITFHWIGERFLSSTMLHICITLLPGLVPFIALGDTLIIAAAVMGVIGLTFIGVYLSRTLAGRWSVHRKGDLSPLAAAGLLIVICGILATPALWRFNRTLSEMRDHSVRHPLCAFCLVSHRSVGAQVPQGADSIDARLHGLGLVDAVKQRVKTFQKATIVRSTHRSDPLPDAVVIIMESLQQPILNAEAMPNTFQLSRRGLMLRNHFSGGNGTNIGMFSLLNGVEASYFHHSDSFVPLANRLFHDAGYELGFFGGSEGWDDHKMTTFITAKHYDEFYTEPVGWIETDQRAIDLASRFLAPDRKQRKPRLAVVYLYSSHHPFATLNDENTFQPAASDTFVSPYTQANRKFVFNRYRNAVRSLDRMMSPLLSPERIVVVAGDHGESFLDDGTIGHGTRLSEFQNMTSAMIYMPGQTPRVIDELTMHADVLPTLLAGLGIKTNPTNLFEGVDLVSQTDLQLAQRTFASFHYMWPELLLVGPWTKSPERPFGFRAAFSTLHWQVAPLNPIEGRGLEWTEQDGELELLNQELDKWLIRRFGVNPMAENISRVELISRYLHHPDAEIRLRTLETARFMQENRQQVIDLMTELLTDESSAVRERARELIVEMQKRIHD